MEYEQRVKRLLKSSRNGRINVCDFERVFPEVLQQIKSDKNSDCLKFWGWCKNFDEFEQQKIVDPKILSTIGRVAKVHIRRENSYHAGLTHTYGYLLSVLPTRFGYKRDRWVSKVIDKGFQTGGAYFSPAPNEGTLLKNLTFFLARITFDAGRYFTDELTPQSLLKLNFKKLNVTRINEKFSYISTEDQRKKSVTVTTDIVDFLKPVTRHCSLLIYSIYQQRKRALITCFPIDKKTKNELKRTDKAKAQPIRLRYNAVMRNLPAADFVGSRNILQLEL